MNSVVSQQFFKEVFPHYMGFVLSRGIYTAAKLQVAEALQDGPLTVDAIASKKNIYHPRQLDRLLSFLASKNIFIKEGAGLYRNNELSEDLLQARSGNKIISHQDRRWKALGDGELSALQDDSVEMKRPIEKLSRLYLLSRAIYLACKNNLFSDERIKRHIDEVGITEAHFVEAKCKAFILHETKERWNALGSLEEAITNGIVPFEKTNKMAFFEYIHSLDRATVRLFDDAMTFVTEYESSSLLPALADCIKAKCVVADIGGGKGYFIEQLVQKYPETSGILFDLPKTLQDVEASSYVQVVAGSFFDSVPKADLYHFKRVLHDWDDESVGNILKCVHRSSDDHARLILHEMVLPQEEALLFDTLFMACIPGRQRTKEDFCKLLTASGWKVQAIRSTGCWLTQIIASK